MNNQTHINIIIPSRDRWDPLHNALESLEQNTYKDFSVHIILDINPADVPKWLIDLNLDVMFADRLDTLTVKLHRYYAQCNQGNLLMSGDDSVFERDCLEQAMKSMQQYFPDRIGVVGLCQFVNGVHFNDGGFPLMNRQFVDHFPNHQVSCPDYDQYYGDTELWEFAKSINAFYFCETAKLKHDIQNDATTKLGKPYMRSDGRTYKARKTKGYLWGRDFNLIKK